MKKVLLTLTAVLALTVASKYITVQAEEMADEAVETVVENMVNEAVNEMNEVVDVEEVVEDAAAAAGDVAQ